MAPPPRWRRCALSLMLGIAVALNGKEKVNLTRPKNAVMRGTLIPLAAPD